MSDFMLVVPFFEGEEVEAELDAAAGDDWALN